MPETLFEMPELRDSPGGTDGQDVTVTRSHSDSHKRNASLECVDIPDITEDGSRHKVWAHELSSKCATFLIHLSNGVTHLAMLSFTNTHCNIICLQEITFHLVESRI